MGFFFLGDIFSADQHARPRAAGVSCGQDECHVICDSRKVHR